MSHSTLMAAVKSGDEAQLEKSIEEGADVNARGVEESSVLQLAVVIGNLKIARILLDNGADVLQTAKNGVTALHLAVARNDVGMVDVLLRSASRSGKSRELLDEVRTDTGDTAVHLAARIVNPKSHWMKDDSSRAMSTLLLSHGAKYDARNKSGARPIDLSPGTNMPFLMLFKKIEWQFEISQFGAKPTAFGWSASAGAREFLSATNCRDSGGSTLLQVLLKSGTRTETIEFLLKLRSARSSGFVVKANADELAERVRALANSLKDRLERVMGSSSSILNEVARVLRDAKEIVDAVGDYERESYDDVLNVRSIAEAVEYLEDEQRGMSLDERKAWPAVLAVFLAALSVRDAICEAVLIDAVKGGELERVERCLDGNPAMSQKLIKITTSSSKEYSVPSDAFAQMNLQPEAAQPIEKSYMALHLAAKNNHLDIVKCLLKHGAVYCARDDDNKTPEELASDEKVVEFFRMIGRLFALAKDGNSELLTELQKLKSDYDLLAVTNARDEEGCALIQVVVKHERIAQDVLQFIDQRKRSFKKY